MAGSKIDYDFDNDPRTPCKYGSDCYQNNKVHHERFKHRGSVSKEKPDFPSPDNQNKKQKLDQDHSNFLSSKEKGVFSVPQKKKFNATVESNPRTSILLREKERSSISKKLQLKNTPNEFIKQLFLVDMPDDFYSFWEMCKSINKDDPINALKAIKLKLVGPFDVLAGKVKDVYEEDVTDFLRHWRYYYDPPEFQTIVMKDDASCYHLGYYRDDPKEMPVFVASNVLNSKNPEKNGELKIMGPNVFATLNVYLEELKTDPFSRMKVPKLQKSLIEWAKEKGFDLEKNSKLMDIRSCKVVAKTFHGAGIVVPVDKKNDVGYRELTASNSTIKRILQGIVKSKSEEERTTYWEQLSPVITFANIANDECDFGTSLELGLDLFTFGSPLLHRSAKQLLTTAYNLLGRVEFVKIIEAHLEDRRSGKNLSIV